MPNGPYISLIFSDHMDLCINEKLIVCIGYTTWHACLVYRIHPYSNSVQSLTQYNGFGSTFWA